MYLYHSMYVRLCLHTLPLSELLVVKCISIARCMCDHTSCHSFHLTG
jgi:hypothetical protein